MVSYFPSNAVALDIGQEVKIRMKMKRVVHKKTDRHRMVNISRSNLNLILYEKSRASPSRLNFFFLISDYVACKQDLGDSVACILTFFTTQLSEITFSHDPQEPLIQFSVSKQK